jgi:NAD(P) transhydrogenase subunit alpha
LAPGWVTVDLAAHPAANAEPSRPGETVDVDGVKVIGPDNLVSNMAADASQLYAKNLENLLGLLVDEEGGLKIDFEDDIVDAACIAHEGQIRGERTAK